MKKAEIGDNPAKISEMAIFDKECLHIFRLNLFFHWTLIQTPFLRG